MASETLFLQQKKRVVLAPGMRVIVPYDAKLACFTAFFFRSLPRGRPSNPSSSGSPVG